MAMENDFLHQSVAYLKHKAALEMSPLWKCESLQWKGLD